MDADSTAFRIRLIAGFVVLLGVLGVLSYNLLSRGSAQNVQPAPWPAQPSAPPRPSIAAIAASLQPLIAEYAKLDVKTLARSRTIDLSGRQAMIVDLDQGAFATALSERIPVALIATTPKDVGLVVSIHSVTDPQPTYTSKEGRKSYGSTVYLIAIAHPEHQVVTAEKMHLSGSSVYVSSSAVDHVATIAPEQVREFLRKLTHRAS